MLPTKNSQQINASTASFVLSTSDDTIKLREENAQLRIENGDLKDLIADHQKETDDYEDRLEQLQSEKDRLWIRHLNLKRTSEDQNNQLQHQLETLQDQLKEKSGTIQLLEGAKSRLENQISSYQSDFDNAVKQQDKLRKKISDLKKSLSKTRLENKKLQQAVVSLHSNIEQTQQSLSTSLSFSDTSSIATPKRYDRTISMLNSQLSEQAEELSELKDSNTEMAEALQKQTVLLNEYEDQTELLQIQASTAQERANSLAEHVNRLQSSNDFMRSNFEKFQSELNLYRETFDKLSSMLDNSPVESLPGRLNEIINSRISADQAQSLLKMRAYCDSLTRFILTYFTTNEVILLDRPKEIFGDQELIESLVTKIQDIRSFTDSFSGEATTLVFDELLTSPTATRKVLKEADSVELGAIAVLTTINGRLKQAMVEQTQQLDAIRGFIPVNDGETTANATIRFIKGLQSLIRESSSKIRKFYGSEFSVNGSEALEQYVSASSATLDNMVKELGAPIGYNKMTIDTLCHDVAERILALSSELEDAQKQLESLKKEKQQETDQECQNLVEQLAESQQNVMKLEREQRRLQTKVSENQIVIQDLQNKLEDTKASEARLYSDIQLSRAREEEAQEAVKTLRNEILRIREQQKERVKQQQKQTDAILADGRKHMELEMAHNEQKYKLQISTLAGDIEELRKKNASAKKKIKKTKKVYEGKLSDLHSQILLLQKANESLRFDNSQLQDQTNEIPILEERINVLSAEKSSLLQKSLLTSPIKSPAVKSDEERFLAQIASCLQTHEILTKQKALAAITTLVQSTPVRILDQGDEEWINWAKKLVDDAGGKSDSLSRDELRNEIRKTMISAGSGIKMMRMMQQNRTQKLIMATMSKELVNQAGGVSLKGVILCMMFAQKIVKEHQQN